MLLAQFCESYDLSKDELKYIAAMAKAIIGMQVSDYVTAYEMKQDTISDIVFSDYMYLISDSCICYNDHMTIIQPSYKEEFTVQIIEKIKEISTPCIKLIGINIEEDTFDLNFCDKEKIIFEKCNFIKNPLIFESCKEVIIKDCTFENFSTRTVILNDVDNVLIDKCKFTNCKMVYRSELYQWDRLGGVIFSDRPSSIGRFELINTIFTDCGGNNMTNCYKSAFISNIDSFVDNCSFKNCWHKRSDFIDPDDSKRTMFTPDSSAMNCKYEDSALFN